MPYSHNRITDPDWKLPVRLIKARNALGLTANELAKRIPVHASVICNIENERNSPKASTIVKICKALDVSADYLLGLKEEMK